MVPQTEKRHKNNQAFRKPNKSLPTKYGKQMQKFLFLLFLTMKP